MPDAAAQAYYEAGPELAGPVLDALRRAGREVDPLDPDDLAGLDEFHGLGRPATLTLAQLAGVAAGTRVLDVGAGIGGPARVLARHFGARVTALDPSRRFCDLDAELCRRSGLAARVEVVCGDARRVPFADGQFDLVWTQAVWQSVEDKAAMLREMHRVLVPGGRLALYEVVEGPAGGELQYPVPWADGPEESFLVAPDEIGRLAGGAGFTPERWLENEEVVARIAETAGSGAPGLATGVEGVTLALVMPDFEARMAGLARNLGERRIGTVMAVLSRA
ncbi:MAG: class I SAM-dependent methyltransferase [Nocardioidaceae bacterium]